jgi:hypothetical protein
MKRTNQDDGAKDAKRKKFDLPTSDEQRQLHQMEILMKNNLLNLQCKELIEEMEEKSRSLYSSKKLSAFLSSLEKDLMSTSKKHSCHDREISFEWVESQRYPGLSTPLSLQPSSEPVNFMYRSPVNVAVIGSYKTQSVTAPFYNIDVSVTIPKESVDARDILDFGYFNKRKLFLAGLRKTLEICNNKLHNKNAYHNFETVYFKCDDRKPVLQFQPVFSDSVVIRIFPTVSIPSFLLDHKFLTSFFFFLFNSWRKNQLKLHN